MAAVRLDPMQEFFATTQEIAAWAPRWIGDYSLDSLLVRHRPFGVIDIIDWTNIEQAISLSRERFVVLGPGHSRQIGAYRGGGGNIESRTTRYPSASIDNRRATSCGRGVSGARRHGPEDLSTYCQGYTRQNDSRTVDGEPSDSSQATISQPAVFSGRCRGRKPGYAALDLRSRVARICC